MKIRLLTSSIMASLVLYGYGCSSNQQSTQGDTIQIDVTKNYPEKEIKLTDIAEVSYVRFEADEDEYLFQGNPVSVTKNHIVIYTYSGDFLSFSREGKAKSRFNRKGEGPEEYVNMRKAFYDEENDELFVSLGNSIKIYTVTGEYKRTLSLPKKAWINELVLYDNNSLILYDVSVRQEFALRKLNKMTGTEEQNETTLPEDNDRYLSSIIRVSKTDGSLIEYIDVPENYDIELSASMVRGEMSMVNLGPTNRILNHKNGLLLCNQETDTVFLYTNQSLIPILEQTPSIQTMDPVIYVNNLIETTNYQFIEAITLKQDVSTSSSATYLRFPSTYLVYDKKEGSFYKQKITLDDFKEKEIFIAPITIANTRNAQTGYIQLTLDELKEAYANDKLSGELKDLVASMDEEENDIYVLLDFK